MPRLVLKMMNNRDEHLNRAAAAVECGSMAYAVSSNPFDLPMTLPMRCVAAGAVWYAYETYLQTI